ncbi:hypothetical protein HN670_01290 [bacterium]|jgi:two-component system, chemotaxis family, sensor kinase CheA|nr:hypothetical protein [bacterium]
MTNNKYQNFYLDTATEQLKKLSNLFLSWENKPHDLYLIEDVLRLTHSMKGAAATMDYKKTAQVLHAAEDIFYALLHEDLDVNEKILDVLFKTLQVLEKDFKNISLHGKESSLDAHIKNLQQVLNSPTIKSKVKRKKKKRDPLSYLTHSESSVYTPLEIVVPTARLDKIQRIVDTLLVAKMNVKCMIAEDVKLAQACLEIDKIIADLRREIKEMRLLSLAQIFSPIPRLVRELAKEEKKKVDLIIEDNGLSLDKSILDDVMDIVIQLLRNAVVHGITKKQSDGQIIVRTEIVNDKIKIIVADNGQGIDWSNIVKIAVKKKIITLAQSKKLSLKDTKKLIFDSRFSSSKSTNMRSGRGVGMSLVQKRVHDLRGSLSLESNKNKGARFTILLPLPISIFRSLVFQISKFHVALPLAVVDKVVRLPKATTFDKQDSFVYKKIRYPVVSLGKILAVKRLPIITQNIAIIKHNNKKLLLPLPQTTREEEVVIKRIPKVLKKNKVVSFVAIAATGRPVLILNTDYLFD